MSNRSIYSDGTYLAQNPAWHQEDSPWKAGQIMKILQRNGIQPRTVCEVGCGAGGILKKLQENMGNGVEFCGYEISPQAYALCQTKANPKLNFKLKDFRAEEARYDLILLIDLIEHLEDYYDFLRRIKGKGKYLILHVPLELSALALLRTGPLKKSREVVGHLHFFTKDLILQALKDTGLTVVDHFYTAGSTELPAKSLVSALFKLPRSLWFKINQDLAARVLGGYSILILCTS